MDVDNLLPVIRNAVRALILQGDNILLLRKRGGDRGERYALPGGAQDSGETLQQALDRECREEIGTPVQIGELVHVADFFKQRQTEPPSTRQLVEFLFLCGVPEGYTPHNGHKPDKHQIDVVWAPLGELANMPFYSNSLAPMLQDLQKPERRVYLGTVG